MLVLGATGMLGHKLCQVYNDKYDLWYAARSEFEPMSRYGIYRPERFLGGFDACSDVSVWDVLTRSRPDVVINCVGIVKQLPQAQSPIPAIQVNALFPHRLAETCQSWGARLIHLGTDCVFSGRKGMYKEEDSPDPEDLYGRTKMLGEVTSPGCLTIRTSMIGREIRERHGLVEWFLSNAGLSVKGYTNAVFSGFTTKALADILSLVIDRFPELAGLYHVSADPISKYDLLLLLRDAYGVKVDIQSCGDVVVDRSLDSSRFRRITGFQPRSWPEMISEMAANAVLYHYRRDQLDS